MRSVSTAPQGHAIVGDLTVPADLERTVEEAKAAMGGIDILVNNGGCGSLCNAACAVHSSTST